MTSRFPSTAAGREDSAFGPYWRAVRHHPLLVANIVIATVLVSLIWTGLRSATYESKATVLVTPAPANNATAGLRILTDSNDQTRTLQTAVSVLDSPKAAVIAAEKLKGKASVSDLLANVEIAAQGDSNVVAVTAKSDDPSTAVAEANAYARSILAVRKDSLQAQVDNKIAALQASRKALGNSDPATGAAYLESITQLQAIRDGEDPNFSMLQDAIGSDATGPSKMLVLILSVLGGIVIGVGAALVLDQLERRVRDEEGLIENFPLPVLARIPVSDDERPSPQVREAFRTLQVQLDDLGGDRGRVVMFTSASVGDGKTSAAIELSKTLIASGLSVVLLDLDLRKPDVGDRLGVSSDVLALFGTTPKLTGALVEVPDYPGLHVFSGRPSGGVTPMLEALFRQLPEMLAQAREMADVVVVDTAPLGRVSDALRVAALADDLMFVARPGNTNRSDLRAARELLEHSGLTPTGMIVVAGGGTTYGYYGDSAGLPVRRSGASRSSSAPPPPRAVRTEPIASSAQHRKKRDSLS